MLSFADFFQKKKFRNTNRVSNGLDLDQDRNCVSPDLVLNCKGYQQMTKVVMSLARKALTTNKEHPDQPALEGAV